MSPHPSAYLNSSNPAWEAPPHPGNLDETTLPNDKEERDKIVNDYNEKMDAFAGFSMACPKCKAKGAFEEWTKSHKAAIEKHGKDLPESTKEGLRKKYGMKL